MRGIMGFIEHSENTYHLESALQKAQHVMPRVRRNSTGEYGKYVSLGAFLDAVAKPLHENGIFYCQFVSGGKGRRDFSYHPAFTASRKSRRRRNGRVDAIEHPTRCDG